MGIPAACAVTSARRANNSDGAGVPGVLDALDARAVAVRVEPAMTPQLTSARHTRVTVVGALRSVDVVLPSDERVGRLLPDLLNLVGEDAGATTAAPHARLLVRLDGTALDPDQGMADADISDGQVLRIVDIADVPATPVVHDVTDSVAEDLDGRTTRWGPQSRRWTATTIAALATSAALLTALANTTVAARLPVVWALAGGLAVVGVVGARFVHRPSGVAVQLAALGCAWCGAALSPSGQFGRLDDAAEAAAIAVGALAIALITLGATTALGRAGVTAGIVAAALLGGWGASAVAGASAQQTAAALGVASCVVLGVLPRVALVTSGLTGIDDRRANRESVTRRSVTAALDAAHRTLSLTTITAAASAGTAAVVLGVDPNRWSAPLAALIALTLATRTRVYPLTVQVVAITAAASAAVGGLLFAWQLRAPAWAPVVVLAALAIAAVSAISLRLPDHINAWCRRVCDRLEAASTVALFPVALGVFGIYGQLLHAF